MLFNLGIDASNIRQGGGLTHLSQLLAAARFAGYGIDRVIVWAAASVLARLPDDLRLEKRQHPWLERGLPFRLAWQQLVLPSELHAAGCDLLFSPGGSTPRRCAVPAVVMSQNMLPFEPEEAATFGRLNTMRLKMRLLRLSQGGSFARAAGVVFLSSYARECLVNTLKLDVRRVAIIPHGIEPRFFRAPRRARQLSECSREHPLRLLYVSILMPYKHQIEVARAVAKLRADGVPVVIDFIGTSWGRYGPAFRRECRRLDPNGAFLRWRGEVPFDRLHTLYQEADAFLFASSCENLPNIMIEAMAAGLPILSSDRGPMPEVLGKAGCYFDPYSVDSIAMAIREFVADADLRKRQADDAYERAQKYSWDKCADETFSFIARIAATRSRP